MKAMRCVVALLALAALAATGCGSGSARDAAAKPARLRVLKGSVAVEGKGAARTVAEGKEEAVLPGETIAVGAGAEALLIDGARLEVLAPGTKLAVESADAASGELQSVRLLDGIVTFLFPEDAKKERRFEAVTHSVVAAVKGTVFRVEVRPDGTRVIVARGEVEVRAPAAGSPAQSVTAGRAANATAAGITVDAAPAAEIEAVRVDMLRLKAAQGLQIKTF